MGRYNFTALHVRRRALQYLETKRTTKSPRWLDVTGDIPPAQILIRTPPQPQPLTRQRLKTLPGKDTPQIVVETVPRRPVKTKKASKLFKPLEMRYEEDELRKEFFQDHPWELARPRVLVESDGKDSRGWDWSKMRQPRKKLDGESVVQRQLHLLHTTPNITKAEAYDIARREFYALRHQEDIERRVAQEEAQSTGAYFGKSMQEVGMELENREYDNWQEWAKKELQMSEQARATFSGNTLGAIASGDPGVIEKEELEDELEAEEAVSPSTAPPRQGGRSRLALG